MSFPQRYDRGAAATQFGSMQLPIGWQVAYSQDGDLYYIDHNTRTTHWQIPPEVLQTMNQNTGYRVGRVRRGIDRTKLKTKMCMNIQNGGKCTWGEYCAFAHTSDELAALPHGGGGGGGGGAQRGGSQRGSGDNFAYYNVGGNGIVAAKSPNNGSAGYWDKQLQQQPFMHAQPQSTAAQ